MYDTDDDASISGKSCEHFGWDWPEKDSPGTEVAGEVVFYPPVHEDVAEEVIKMANDQAEALCDQEVTDECLDDEHVEERRPSKRIRSKSYVVPTGRVKVPAGRYVVPTGKDNVIVSAGRSKVIPASRTILVLVVLCLLRVDSIVS
ncbi:hypothetical protein Tco_1041766, partial [Tanacetum coccineum]